MLRKKLLDSQSRFHKIYQERIASADGRQEAMEKDLVDFDKGIELLLQGQCHRVCKNEIKRFATVYGWILQKSLPLSFRDYGTTTGFKKINKQSLEKSPNFAYIVGIYQKKVKVIHSQTLTIGIGSSSLEQEVEKCFHRLHMVPRKKEIVYKKNRCNQRIYYCSSDLMSYISEITENNSCIPLAFFIPKLITPYLSGFSAQASISYSTVKSQCSNILRKYPQIVITKQGNVPLLSAVNSAFHFLGIDSYYDLQSNPNQIYVTELKSIKKFIDLGLFRSYEKMAKLKELYKYWKDTNKFDYNGAYHKQRNKILLERFRKNETELDENLTCFDEDSDEEITCFDEEIED